MASCSQSAILHLPGTTLEGGGQLLRLSVGLAALTSTPIRISDIRGNRSGGGGLKGQHLAGMCWLAQASGARVSGMEKKSKELVFVPSASAASNEHLTAGLTQVQTRLQKTIDIGSPGAVTLVFQAILPYLLLSPAADPLSVTILGGTNVSNSPSIDYVVHVLVPMLSLIGFDGHVNVRVNSRGWSTGRNEMGSVTFVVQPMAEGVQIPAFSMLDRGEIIKVEAFILAPRSLHEIFSTATRDAVVKERGLGIRLAKEQLTINVTESGHPKRLYLLLVAVSENSHRLARDWLWGANIDFRSMKSGRRKGRSSEGGRAAKDNDEDAATTISKAIESVVEGLAQELAHGGCVDEHMRDQLVVFQALAAGRSVVSGGCRDDAAVKPSLHTETAHWVAHEMLGVDFEDDGSCTGVGYKPGEHDDGPSSSSLIAELEKLHV